MPKCKSDFYPDDRASAQIKLTRRDFLKATGVIAGSVLLAACKSVFGIPLSATPAPTLTATSQPTQTPTHTPTNTPDPKAWMETADVSDPSTWKGEIADYLRYFQESDPDIMGLVANDRNPMQKIYDELRLRHLDTSEKEQSEEFKKVISLAKHYKFVRTNKVNSMDATELLWVMTLENAFKNKYTPLSVNEIIASESDAKNRFYNADFTKSIVYGYENLDTGYITPIPASIPLFGVPVARELENDNYVFGTFIGKAKLPDGNSALMVQLQDTNENQHLRIFLIGTTKMKFDSRNWFFGTTKSSKNYTIPRRFQEGLISGVTLSIDWEQPYYSGEEVLYQGQEEAGIAALLADPFQVGQCRTASLEDSGVRIVDLIHTNGLRVSVSFCFPMMVSGRGSFLWVPYRFILRRIFITWYRYLMKPSQVST